MFCHHFFKYFFGFPYCPLGFQLIRVNLSYSHGSLWVCWFFIFSLPLCSLDSFCCCIFKFTDLFFFIVHSVNLSFQILHFSASKFPFGSYFRISILLFYFYGFLYTLEHIYNSIAMSSSLANIFYIISALFVLTVFCFVYKPHFPRSLDI